MATTRPEPAATTDITDEWGIHDPAKAGMPALFARLARPVLRAAPSSRSEHRRALRPERPGEGIGGVIAEAQRRAGLAPPDEQRPVAAPSPRRPRGPVPLAAWAHAAVAPTPAPRRDDKRGFWRGVFRIPTDVALVAYAHGARIHRLQIDAGDDYAPDFV